MHENSKIIYFVLKLSDMLEYTYYNSYFCKIVRSIAKTFKKVWKDSVFGRIVDNLFSLETHRNSVSYRVFNKLFISFIEGFIERIPLKEAVIDSKFIRTIRSFYTLDKESSNKESLIKNMFKDSIFVKCAYQLWQGMD